MLGGTDQKRTPTSTTRSVIISVRLWMPSATTARLLPMLPAVILNALKHKFTVNPVRATRLTFLTPLFSILL